MANVLIIDDEKSVRLTLGEFLRNDGHEVQVVADAETAVRFLEKGDFDVVVCDITLPGVTGVELLRIINGTSAHVQVVMITDEATVGVAAESLRAGAFDYLLKPVSKEAVLKAVSNAAKVKVLDDEKRRLEEENRFYCSRLEQLVDKQTQVLRESEDRYRRLVHHSPDGIAVHCDGKVVFANESMMKMLGAECDDLIGKPILDYVHPDYREIVWRRVEEVLQKGKAVPRLEEVFIAVDGTEIHVDAVALPFTYQGKPAVQVVVRDITEQKQLEEQLRESQKMESVGLLAGGVAHDFNNLLTGIIGYTQFVIEQIDENSPLYDDLTEVKELARRAEDLTRQLLAFSRRQTLRPVILNINALIANITKMLGRLIGEDIKLEFRPSPDLYNVRADPSQIEQILMNLAVNARDAMPDGGSLTIETSNVYLDETYADKRIGIEPGHYVMLTVTDTGHGMDKETRQRAFEPFFSTKEIGKGSGLGLSTVYGIVRQHGGNIWVYSGPNEGTTFKICLPCVDEETDADAKDVKHKQVPRGTETILIVEDSREVRRIVERSLRSQGYEVVSAASPQKAEEMFAKHEDKVALLLTDVIMPERNGQELYNELRKRRPTLKVLYMSGYTDDSIAHHGILTPNTPFMQKPFNASELAQKVREVLDG